MELLPGNLRIGPLEFTKKRSPRRSKSGRGFHMIFTFGASSFRGLGRAFERAMVTENVVKRGDTFSIEHADESNKNGDFPDVQWYYRTIGTYIIYILYAYTILLTYYFIRLLIFFDMQYMQDMAVVMHHWAAIWWVFSTWLSAWSSDCSGLIYDEISACNVMLVGGFKHDFYRLLWLP